MKEQDKGSINNGVKVEFKEGERGPLSCNKAIVRSPSLDVDSYKHEDVELAPNAIITPKTIEIFTDFSVTLKKIHMRLLMEGYTIKDGMIYKPIKYKQDDNNLNHDSKNGQPVL